MKVHGRCQSQRVAAVLCRSGILALAVALAPACGQKPNLDEAAFA